MRFQFYFAVVVTLLFVPAPLMAEDEPGYWPTPFRPAQTHQGLDSRESSESAPAWARGLSVRSERLWYGLSWDDNLVPAASSELRDPVDGRVFTTEVDPSVRVGFSRSSLQLHRRGLKYHGADDAWSVGLRYQRLKVAPDLELLIDERTERPHVLKMEWSVRFQ